MRSVAACSYIPAVSGPLFAYECTVFCGNSLACILSPSISIIELHIIYIAFVINIDHRTAVTVDGNIGIRFFAIIGETRIALIIRATDSSADRGRFCHLFNKTITIVIGIFLPVLNLIIRLSSRPLCRQSHIRRRHRFRLSRSPSAKGIARLYRVIDGNRRAITGVHGVSAVAAIQIQAQQIIVAVIVDFHFRAAVSGNFGSGIVQQRRETLIRLLQAVAHHGFRVAAPGFRIHQRVLVIVHILLVVLDREAHQRRAIGNENRFILLNVRHIDADHRLVRGIAHHRRAGDVRPVAAALGNGSRPRIRRLTAVGKNIVNHDGVAVFFLSILRGFLSIPVSLGGNAIHHNSIAGRVREHRRRNQRQNHHQRHHQRHDFLQAVSHVGFSFPFRLLFEALRSQSSVVMVTRILHASPMLPSVSV